MSANPHANGGLLLRDLRLPDFRDYAVPVEAPGTARAEATRVLGTWLRDVIRDNPSTFRLVGPDETASNRLDAVFEVTDRVWMAEIRPTDEHLAPTGRVHRGPLRAPLPGLAGGLPADRPARPVQLLRGVHPRHRLDVQPARQVAEDDPRDPLAPPDRVAQLPADEPRLAPGPQRLQPPGPGLHRPRRQQEGRGHPRLPAAGRELPAVGRRPLPAQPELRQRHRRRQAAGARLPLDRRGRPPLHARHRHLGLGQQRRRRAGRRARLLRRRPDARDAGRRRATSASTCRTCASASSTSSTSCASSTRPSTRTACRAASSTRCSRPTGRSSSPTTAIRGSSTG